MARPRVESAVAPIGGYRPTSDLEPSPELVRLLADWLGRDEATALKALAIVGRSYGAH